MLLVPLMFSDGGTTGDVIRDRDARARPGAAKPQLEGGRH